MIGTLGRPLRRSLRARLVAYFLLLSSLTVLVVGLVVYARATDDLTRSVFERLAAVADTKADALDRWIDEQSRNVVFVGALPGLGDDARTYLESEGAGSADADAARERIVSILSTVVQQTADAQELMILDLDGTVRISTRSESEATSQAREPFFERGTSHTTVQNVYTSSLTGLPTITVATPLFDQDGLGQRVGVVAANLSLERIDRIVLDRTGLGDSGQSYLVGRDGRFVHAQLDSGTVIGSPGIAAALAGQDGQAVYVDHRGRPVIGVHRWLEEHETALLAELDQDEAFAPARQLALTIGLVGLLSAILLALGIWLIARQVTRPILDLAAVATRVRQGDLEASAATGAEDEVGTLAVAFNEMTAQLRENVATLEARVDERTSELTSALAALGEAEEQYRTLVEQLPLAIYIDRPDSSNTSIYASPQTADMFGYPIERFYEEGFFNSIVHPDDRDLLVGAVGGNVGGSDQRFSYEYRVLAGDGRVVWVRDESWIVRAADGTPQHIQGFMLDITEQTLAAAEIRRQKQYFEALVEVSPVAVVTMDPNERVTRWNPAATTLFGYTREEAIGQRIDDLVFASTEQHDEGRAVTREADETGRAHRLTRRARKDGAPVEVEMVMVPLEVDGERQGYYVIYHDITELQAARRDADAANQAKSAFLAAMSHEIRTPMNAVIGMSGLLADTRLDAEQRDYAETIRTSAEALLTVINDILDFSKIEAGRVELEAAPFSLRTMLRGAVGVLAGAAAAKGISLSLDIDEAVRDELMGDAGRIRQIVLNLLSNAVKFTESGGVSVVASGRPLEGDGAPDGRRRWQVAIEVADTGIGIPPEAMGRMFQSFSQADASIARRFGGTGLGLAISRRLAELMSGSLVAESSGIPGEGSTIRLAILVPEATVDEVLAATSPAGPIEAGRDGQGGLRILLAEDNPVNQKLALRLLQKMGYEADLVEDGRQAVDAVERDGYDVVLMDVQMPELDGLAATREIRMRRSEHDGPWIVAMTASAMEGDRDACFAAGMDDYLSKPIRPAELADALGRVPRRGEAAAKA